MAGDMRNPNWSMGQAPKGFNNDYAALIGLLGAYGQMGGGGLGTNPDLGNVGNYGGSEIASSLASGLAGSNGRMSGAIGPLLSSLMRR